VGRWRGDCERDRARYFAAPCTLHKLVAAGWLLGGCAEADLRARLPGMMELELEHATRDAAAEVRNRSGFPSGCRHRSRCSVCLRAACAGALTRPVCFGRVWLQRDAVFVAELCCLWLSLAHASLFHLRGGVGFAAPCTLPVQRLLLEHLHTHGRRCVC
jgi:hypothetical protein